MGQPAFTIPQPTEATEVPALRSGKGRKDYGPNLFLEPHPEHKAPEGYLALSFDTGKWYEIPVAGKWEEVTMTKGKNKGQTTKRLSGDAAEVTRQLREAAAKLDIGVSIKYFPVLNKQKREVPGQVLIKYLGTTRKQPRQNSNGSEAATEASTEA